MNDSVKKTGQFYHFNGFLDIIKLFVFVASVMVMIYYSGNRTGYHFQWFRIPNYLFSANEGQIIAGPLIKGLLVTLHITSLSLVLSFVIGVFTAIFRLSGSVLARSLARIYLELIRNTPLLVQIFFLYFVLAPIFDVSRFFSAVLALSLFEGAYASEIIRGSIVAVHKGQWEAAQSLGLSKFRSYWHVIFPQAARQALPPLTGQAISLIKDSALVSTIAVYDLTMQGQTIISETFLTFEVWFTIAGMYLFITLILSAITGFMEKRFEAHGRSNLKEILS
ncbi:MAG: amino acid ABC transporter permease [Desulfobacterales bacterium]|nr:amino acid ABC transporter permease [Desulfobacterales bacterium]